MRSESSGAIINVNMNDSTIAEILMRGDYNFEFGIKNHSGHMNCFLNSGLQLIWSLMIHNEHESFIEFLQQPVNQGPLPL